MLHDKRTETEYLIGELIKRAKKEFGKPCKKRVVGCPTCDAHRMIEFLSWWLMIEELNEE